MRSAPCRRAAIKAYLQLLAVTVRRLLEQERAGVAIAADPERVKQAAERAKSG